MSSLQKVTKKYNENSRLKIAVIFFSLAIGETLPRTGFVGYSEYDLLPLIARIQSALYKFLSASSNIFFYISCHKHDNYFFFSHTSGKEIPGRNRVNNSLTLLWTCRFELTLTFDEVFKLQNRLRNVGNLFIYFRNIKKSYLIYC